MTRNQSRLALALVLSLGAAGIAQAVTVAGATNTTATRPAEAETVTTGIVSSIDAGRGVLVVSGRVIHFSPKTATFSDDRRKASADGLDGLKAGVKVTVRSVMKEGGNQALQIVVKD
jgi:hypothetical protein